MPQNDSMLDFMNASMIVRRDKLLLFQNKTTQSCKRVNKSKIYLHQSYPERERDNIHEENGSLEDNQFRTKVTRMLLNFGLLGDSWPWFEAWSRCEACLASLLWKLGSTQSLFPGVFRSFGQIASLGKETNQFVKLRLRGRELDRHQVSADNRMIY